MQAIAEQLAVEKAARYEAEDEVATLTATLCTMVQTLTVCFSKHHLSLLASIVLLITATARAAWRVKQRCPLS